jgi:50S ribosomal subunit-associated GTPase HflX
METIEQLLVDMAVQVECRIPYSDGDVLAEIRKVGTVTEETYGPAGTQITAFVPPSLRSRLEHAGFARRSTSGSPKRSRNRPERT